MRRVLTVVLLVLSAAAFWQAGVSARRSDSEISVAVYDSNPAHVWNRVYAAFLVRRDQRGIAYGEDAVDPPLWMETEHLLAEPSHEHAMAILDEFLRTHAETAIHDPVKRVMLQRDLWSVFDWTVQQQSASKRPQYDKEKLELQVRLAEVLRRLALTPEEMKTLPDTYAQAVASGAFAKEYDAAHPERPFLPPDLFDPHGTWAGITPSPDWGAVVAKMHVFNLSGRSSFLVFVRLPGGHKATMDYFRSLWDFPQPYVQGPSFAADQAEVNPDLPSFPAGTEVALVRRATLFDSQGSLEESRIVESVQIRVYRAISQARERDFSGGDAFVAKNSGQEFYEFKLSRPLLFSGKNGGLRAIGSEDRELSTFQSMGDDPIESKSDRPARAGDRQPDPQPELKTCVWCHSGGGVRSLNSREALFRPNRMQVDPENSDYGSIYWGDGSAAAWKQNHYDWGLLNGYWKAAR